MNIKLCECLLLAGLPRRICGFKIDENIYFYNQSLFRWLSIGGGIRGTVNTKTYNGKVIHSGFLPEGVLITKLHSGKFGLWSVTPWGYEIKFDIEDNPLWI